MPELRFVFAVHNHQPVGNFEAVVVKAFRDCYRPFLERLERHPRFRFSLHFSGPLWEHMQSRERGLLELVRAMADRGQVELLGGGFCEPILTVIPEADRTGQVRMMSDFLEAHFGRRPKGLWLTERVWEPHLAKSLAQSGIAYTLLDEEHFRYAGVRNIHASFVTEEEGFPLRILPIDKKLRYMIPFHSLEELDGYLKEIRAAGGAAILGDDGEKFGLWPGTKKWVYEEGWLERFLAFVEEREVRMMTGSEYLEAEAPAGRVYIPPASYEEMSEWVLEPADARAYEGLRAVVPEPARRFVRGGFFRDFFLKYPESHHLHMRMLMVSRAVHAAAAPAEALLDLYRGQGNDPYWHGVFGGLYLPHLREAAYHHLIEAEKATPAPAGWTALDCDIDGRDELFLRGGTFNLLLKPSFGGGLAELDYVPWARNLSNVLARRPETYHFNREEDGGGGKSIHEMAKKLPPRAMELTRYDWHPRYSLLDHFLPPEATEEDFRRIDLGEQGDFVNQPYAASVSGETVVLERRGGVWAEGERVPVAVRKTVEPGPGRLAVAWDVENLSARAVALRFGSEWNLLAFPHEVEFHRRGWVMLYGGRLSFEPRDPAELWTAPLETLSQSEEGFDIIHQGYSFMPVWTLTLGPGKVRRIEVEIRERAAR
ncbi:MAG TPA: alpha-amylase/4-alpha-glucanotransferase domain-containing protein [Terriglobales bacterium]|nr:alpha-amylase/4-alpha-glucanotransferase domain-containing protein [Terriglobales bacterium]